MNTTINESIYNIDDSDAESSSDMPHTPPQQIQLQSLGKVSKVTVNGTDILIVNPAVVEFLERQLKDLQSKNAQLHDKLQRMQQQQQAILSTMSRLERELGSKISYD